MPSTLHSMARSLAAKTEKRCSYLAMSVFLCHGVSVMGYKFLQDNGKIYTLQYTYVSHSSVCPFIFIPLSVKKVLVLWGSEFFSILCWIKWCTVDRAFA